MKDLEELLLRAGALETADPVARVRWIEAVADATARAGLGQAGDRAALDLRASLGAIVAYSRSPRTDRDRIALEATVRTFTARALYGLYGALADAYRELGLSGPNAARCRELASVFLELQRALASGAPPSEQLRARLRRLEDETPETEP
ncbi:MAG: hypothetical protein HYV07_01620 [Deltaproteobacteria bacterium]|nr:hypothetical protein [Deltaproteobacteria bacterium]